MHHKTDVQRLARWLKVKMPGGGQYAAVKRVVETHHLHTICMSGRCPNIGDCWSRGTATFMILGDICTRSCRFCGVRTGKPGQPDPDEPFRVGESVRLMKLKHCVITSVDRDDLEDGGAGHWVKTIGEIRKQNPGTTMEVLIPDFRGNQESLQQITACKPEVISHNLETVERLTPVVRSAANYRRSLRVLEFIALRGFAAKSGIMLGLGETEKEVLRTMDDLIGVGCSVLTMGQYLRPSEKHYPVIEYPEPRVFDRYKNMALEKGFWAVESAPLVRSSFHAEKHVRQ